MGSFTRYRDRRLKNNSGWLYIVLSIVFVIVMFKWGLPTFINLLAGPNTAKVGSINSGEDIVPPQTPMLAALPEATNSASIKITGYTEAEVEVTAWRNEELASSDKSGSDGGFSMTFKLNTGENRIQIKARDSSGNESQSAVKTIIFDNKEIDISIESPTDGAEIFGKNNQNIAVIGKVGKTGVVVNINGVYAKVKDDGSFSATIHLNEGDNEILVRATDKAGNSTQKTIKVKLTF